MRQADRVELVAFAERHRKLLPGDFFRDLESARLDLSRGVWPEVVRPRGRPGSRGRAVKAVLEEIYVFLCTGDRRYANLRRSGRQLGMASTGAMAGYVAAAAGVSVAAATGAVAFVVLGVVQIGVAAFCRTRRQAAAAETIIVARKGVRPKARTKESGVR
jgi:hypothetical protein